MQTHNPTLDDPLCFLYNFIYKKEKRYSHIRMPETIIYEHNFARVWYYYEGSQLYKKSPKEVADNHLIYNTFSRSTDKRPDAVVAVYITYVDQSGQANPYKTLITDTENRAYNRERRGLWTDVYIPPTVTAASAMETVAILGVGDEKFNVNFLTRAQLMTFIFEKPKGDRGVLQRYLRSRLPRNEIIKAIWTPCLCMVHRRQNMHRHTDPQYALYERNVTEKMHVNHVEEGQIAPTQAERIRAICNRMIDDMRSLEGGQHKIISKMILFFRFDKRFQLYVLFCPVIEYHIRPPKPTIGPNPLPSEQLITGLPNERITQEEAGQLAKLGKLEKIRTAPLHIQYQFFKQAVLGGGNPQSSLLATNVSAFNAAQGITPKQSLLIRRFEKLVHDVESARLQATHSPSLFYSRSAPSDEELQREGTVMSMDLSRPQSSAARMQSTAFIKGLSRSHQTQQQQNRANSVYSDIDEDGST